MENTLWECCQPSLIHCCSVTTFWSISTCSRVLQLPSSFNKDLGPATRMHFDSLRCAAASSATRGSPPSAFSILLIKTAVSSSPSYLGNYQDGCQCWICECFLLFGKSALSWWALQLLPPRILIIYPRPVTPACWRVEKTPSGGDCQSREDVSPAVLLLFDQMWDDTAN